MGKISKVKIFEEIIPNNRLEEMEKLLQDGLDPMSVRNEKYDKTNLLSASLNNNKPEMVKLLFKYGAYVTSGLDFSKCVKNDCREILEVFVSSYKNQTYKGLLEQQYHIPVSHFNKLKDILCNPTNYSQEEIYITVENDDYQHLFHYVSNLSRILNDASRENNLQAVCLLLAYGALPEFYKLGNPLVLASKNGNNEMIDVLIDRGAKINQRSHGFYHYPIEAAVGGVHYKTVIHLVEKGATLRENLIEILIDSYNRNQSVSTTKLKEEIDLEEMKNILHFLLDEKIPLERDRFMEKYNKENQWLDTHYKNNSVLNLVKDTEVLDMFEPYIHTFPPDTSELFYSKSLPLLFKKDVQ